MNFKLLHQLPPSENNPRNSEGAFIRGKNGEILYAYSRYTGKSWNDHATCDIALIISFDEGRTWSEPRIIAKASDYGTENVMSVSALELLDGRIAFFYLVKRRGEKDFVITDIGRAVSEDGINFTSELCRINADTAYYIINNDRLVRLSNGRILAPTGYIPDGADRSLEIAALTTSCLYSDDDGKTFEKANFDLRSAFGINKKIGLQEPGVIEREDGLYLWMRTDYGTQYESFSSSGVDGFGEAHPSIFTSALSPMQMKDYDGVVYTVYNPVPRYNGREMAEGTWGRTPLVIRKSTDGGKTFGPLNVIEDDPTRGYSYPAMFKTNDGRLLLGYCRGEAVDGNNLCRIGISDVEIDTIE
jgi:hypothetical protein